MLKHGGWLMPGQTMARNDTGQPERILAPGQDRAVPAKPPMQVHLQYYGPRAPTPEMQQAMLVNLATAVGGAGDRQPARPRPRLRPARLPLGQLWAKVEADLAADTITALCPHPPDHLVLPSGSHGCMICVRIAQAVVDDRAPRVCACCGHPATQDSIRVLGEIFAWIRACDDCSQAGSVTVHPK